MTLNNTASLVTLGELNKNITKVGAAIAKISSGDRIPSAKYDSAGLAMSEIMREQLRSLHQDQQNVQNGNAMFRVASGGVDDIIQNIRRLKELAINAANDSNSDLDRATIQKEIDSTLATVDDISLGTEYNGRKLLDGTFSRKFAAADSIEEGLVEPIQTQDSNTEPTGSPTMIASSMTISEDGVYQLDESLGMSTINITATNVKIIGASSAKDVSVVMQNPGSLWIEDFKANITGTRNAIKFDGTGSFLHFKGSNSITQTGSGSSAAICVQHSTAIYGEETSGTAGSLTIDQADAVNGAGIGSNQGDRTNSGNITIMSGTIDVTHRSGYGCAIGAGISGSCGGLTMFDGKVTLKNHTWAPALGSDAGSSCGRIIINGGDLNAQTVFGSDTTRYVVGVYSTSSFVEDVQFNGGDIYIRNGGGGRAVDRLPRVPAEGFSNGDKVYEIHLPYVDAPPDDSSGSTTSRRAEYDNPLVIHHGTKSNQMDRFYVDSMRPRAMGIESIEVTTRDQAETAIGKIESALEYALDVATDLGAYMKRLEYTESNIETRAENTALSDSVLRDADMAKEMTEYTRYNILTQSSQAMLAQAGQNQSQVLSLLQ